MNNSLQPSPMVGRPYFPEGYIPAKIEAELLPWSYVQERMTSAIHYWIATATLHGKPYVSPVWGVWVDDLLYFDGSPQTRRGRNIAANPQTAVHLESGEQAVFMNGATLIYHNAPERSLAERLAQAYRQKYTVFGYSPEPDQWDQGGLFVFTPHVALAWKNFIKDPTRFVLRQVD